MYAVYVHLLVDNLYSVLLEMRAQPLCSLGRWVNQERTGSTLSKEQRYGHAFVCICLHF